MMVSSWQEWLENISYHLKWLITKIIIAKW